MQKNNSSRVGKFDAGISGINQLGLRDILNYKVLQEKIPVLGICLGMQLLAQKVRRENCLAWGG